MITPATLSSVDGTQLPIVSSLRVCAGQSVWVCIVTMYSYAATQAAGVATQQPIYLDIRNNIGGAERMYYV